MNTLLIRLIRNDFVIRLYSLLMTLIIVITYLRTESYYPEMIKRIINYLGYTLTTSIIYFSKNLFDSFLYTVCLQVFSGSK